MGRALLCAAALASIACARGPVVTTARTPLPGLTVAIDRTSSGLQIERVAFAIDGAVRNARAVHFTRLPDGPHTISVRIEATYACGLLEERRGRLVVRDTRTHETRSPTARLRIALREREASVSPGEGVTVAWLAEGTGLAERDPCAAPAVVTATGCESEHDGVLYDPFSVLPLWFERLVDLGPRPTIPATLEAQGSVSVVGAVRAPREVPAYEATTVGRAVCLAGGLTPTAASLVLTRRNEGRRVRTRLLPDADASHALEAGDVLRASERTL